jgi:hypothetical protein
MSEIDYPANWKYHLPGDNRRMHMRFRRNWGPKGGAVFDGTGQLIAVVIRPGHPDNHEVIALSRPNVNFDLVEDVLDGFGEWAWTGGTAPQRTISLDIVRRRLAACGLGTEATA